MVDDVTVATEVVVVVVPEVEVVVGCSVSSCGTVAQAAVSIRSHNAASRQSTRFIGNFLSLIFSIVPYSDRFASMGFYIK